MLVKQKKLIDIGVWSSQSKENTEIQLKAMFGRFFTQYFLMFIYLPRLLFVSFTAREQYAGKQAASSAIEDSELKPLQIPRNLSQIYNKYPQYSEASTIVISNHYNQLEDY